MPNEVKAQNTIDLTSLKELSDTVVSTDQYFWHTTTNTGFGAGTHITQKPQDEVLQDPTNAGGNTFIDSNHFAIRDGLVEVASFDEQTIKLGANSIQSQIEMLDATGILKAEQLPYSQKGTLFSLINRYETDPDSPEDGDYVSLLSLGHGAISLEATVYDEVDGEIEDTRGSLTVSPNGVEARADFSILTFSSYSDIGVCNLTLNGNGIRSPQMVVQGDVSLFFGIGTSGTNHGVYSNTASRWLVYSDGIDVIVGGVNTNNIFQKAQIAKGGESLGAINAGAYKDFNISFGKTFSSVPTVVCCLSSTSTSSDLGSISVTPINETTTGFTARVFNNSSNQRSPAIRWIATNGG